MILFFQDLIRTVTNLTQGVMMKKICLCIALALLMLTTAVVPMAGASERPPGSDMTDTEFNYMARRNRAFLEATRKIVEESDKVEPASYLATAEGLSREATEHFKAGERVLARLDLLDSTRLAILAITLSKIDSRSIRDIVIEEELAMKEMRDMAMKEALIGRRVTEVEVFIQTAERLVGDTPAEELSKDVTDGIKRARALLEKSRAELRGGDPDAAFDDINAAYVLATDSVKAIKRKSGEVITFPPPPSGDELALYEYELKKNNTHAFFASEVVRETDTVSYGMVRESVALRDDAVKLKDAGNVEEATRRLRRSTELLKTAIRSSVADR